jgi:hypothetical protein
MQQIELWECVGSHLCIEIYSDLPQQPQDTATFHGFNSVFDIHGDLLSDMRTAGQIVLPQTLRAPHGADRNTRISRRFDGYGRASVCHSKHSVSVRPTSQKYWLKPTFSWKPPIQVIKSALTNLSCRLPMAMASLLGEGPRQFAAALARRF